MSLQIKDAPVGTKSRRLNTSAWTIEGEAKDAVNVLLLPVEGQWDMSTHSLFGITMRNAGQGTLRIDARLNNQGAADWAKSSRSQIYLRPGETGTLTIAFPMGWDKDDSPEAFEPASAKPNGWRSHWKSFDPNNVKNCRLTIRSSTPSFEIDSLSAHLSWPYGKEANATLLELPFIDKFGQAIPLSWKDKVTTIADLQQDEKAESLELQTTARISSFNQFGGYEKGPTLTSTGFFRTEKVDGKWWLVDPSGKLFWSHGVCTVGNRAIAPLNPDRRALFSYLPEPGTDEHKAAIVPYKPYGKWGKAVDFLRLNTMRKYGNDWENKSRDMTHRRLHAWGFNTLGAWSDAELLDDRRTPYTEILHIWAGEFAFEHTADPFEKGFEKRLLDAVTKLAEKRKNDPWMIGVFIDNEIVWHNNLPERVINRGTKQPAYQAFVNHLEMKYQTLAALNKAWGIQATSWQQLVPGKTKAWNSDRLELFGLVADRYYRLCKQAIEQHLPNHLYLGSRVHTCPPVVANAMAQYVDVFSINHYAPLAGTAQLPKDADLPVMITEFHFGTLDRGVIGMSLSPVHDQLQRARSYGAYVTAGLLDKHIVGTHLFAYSDHSSVGRPNENYQIGLIDITDQPYPEMTNMSREIARGMYELRLSNESDTMKAIHQVLKSVESH
ncbi:MAG: beta-galactosidase [Phycisphaeraceae bacterium]